MTQGELESRIQSLLAGTVAEEMIFDDVSSGAQNDLERATEIARSMVMDFGMSRLGRVNYRESNRSPFLIGIGDAADANAQRADGSRDRSGSQTDSSTKDCSGRVTSWRIAGRRWWPISDLLIKQEVIDATDLKRIIEENSSSPMIVPGTDADGKKRGSPVAKPARDIDASEMEASGG